ncbi:MAG: S24 family peptidase [Anaerolineaceae bacterium]|nr:S24 family peptidase [Anaerolineaceae bacterium]MBR6707677.1 S24 family peptidase [Clostridia bacterium]
MEPTYPSGSYVYVGMKQQVSYGQTGLFIVKGETIIREYQPEGLVSRNGHFETILINDRYEFRCCGRVLGIVEDGDMAAGPLLEKIEIAFEEEPNDL